MRLRHRYLDLRRERMRDAIELRHAGHAAIREFLDGEGFLEIETPVLTRSTPEGARDFLVPSRAAAGLVLRAAAVAAALQAAPDGRRLRALLPDRPLLSRRGPARRPPARLHPARHRDVVRRASRTCSTSTSACSRTCFGGVDGLEVALPFPRIPYDEAMARYGTDKPDLRFGARARRPHRPARARPSSTPSAPRSRRRRRQGPERRRARAARAPSSTGWSTEAQELGAKGLCGRSARRTDGARRSPSSCRRGRARGDERAARRRGGRPAAAGRRPAAGCADAVLGALRQRARRALRAGPAGEPGALLDRRLAAVRVERGARAAGTRSTTRSPRPAGELDPGDPGEARALAYDVVWNGSRAGRRLDPHHRPDVQRAVFEVLGIGPEEAEARFGFLLEALRYGAPPHGGIAYGLDRCRRAAARNATRSAT